MIIKNKLLLTKNEIIIENEKILSNHKVNNKFFSRSGSLEAGNYTGSAEVTHIDRTEGFWCYNEEQPDGQDCADFMVAFCCPQPFIDDKNITYVMDGTCVGQENVFKIAFGRFFIKNFIEQYTIYYILKISFTKKLG